MGAALFLSLFCSPALAAKRSDFPGYAEGAFVTAERFAEESNRQFLAQRRLKTRQQAEYEGPVDQEAEKRKAKERKEEGRRANQALLLVIAAAAAAYVMPKIPDSWTGGHRRLRDSLAVTVALAFATATWFNMSASMSTGDVIPWPLSLLCFASIIIAPLLRRVTVGPIKDQGQIFRLFLGYFLGLNILFGIFGSPFTLALLFLFLGAFSSWGTRGTSSASFALLLLASFISTHYFYHTILTWGDDDRSPKDEQERPA